MCATIKIDAVIANRENSPTGTVDHIRPVMKKLGKNKILKILLQNLNLLNPEYVVTLTFEEFWFLLFFDISCTSHLFYNSLAFELNQLNTL
jgi:hypothetical protein